MYCWKYFNKDHKKMSSPIQINYAFQKKLPNYVQNFIYIF